MRFFVVFGFCFGGFFFFVLVLTGGLFLFNIIKIEGFCLILPICRIRSTMNIKNVDDVNDNDHIRFDLQFTVISSIKVIFYTKKIIELSFIEHFSYQFGFLCHMTI